MQIDIPAFMSERRASERGLLDLLRQRMNKRIDLGAIAEADYGTDVEEHYSVLEKIFDSGDVPPKISLWHPSEVLELFSYSRPEDPSWRPGNAGERGHLQRGFACAVLLRAVDVSSFDDEDNETLAALIDSCCFLGADYRVALEAFILWRFQQFPKNKMLTWEDATGCGFYALGYLMLCCEAYGQGDTFLHEASLATLFDWVIRVGDLRRKGNVSGGGTIQFAMALGHDLRRPAARSVARPHTSPLARRYAAIAAPSAGAGAAVSYGDSFSVMSQSK